VQSVQRHVTGEVTVRLFKGKAVVVARKGDGILYDPRRSTYGAGDAFDHRAAEGWIDLEALPLSTFRRLHPVAATVQT